MGPVLRYIGLVLLAALAWIVVADSTHWIPPGSLDSWIFPVGAGGVGCIALGVLLGMLSPVARRMRQGRCVRCGGRTERGQTYCASHLQETVNEYRDNLRDRVH